MQIIFYYLAYVLWQILSVDNVFYENMKTVIAFLMLDYDWMIDICNLLIDSDKHITTVHSFMSYLFIYLG